MTPHPGGFSVLVVSAEGSIRQTRVLLLEQAGHTPQVAESCARAKEALQLSQFDLVILDHTLSKDDRIHFIQSMHKTGSITRVLLLHKSAADCGADLHLDSREGPDALIAAIDSILKRPSATAPAGNHWTPIKGRSQPSLKIWQWRDEAKTRRRTIE